MLSANAATVRVSRAIGERAVIAAARKNGIVSPLTPVPAIALGAEGVTPLELVTSYAPFANGGKRVTPRLVTRIEAPDGTLLWTQESAATIPAMDPGEAYELTEMLEGVVNYGTGKGIRDYGITGPIAGKTGTTNDGMDVWFVGYTPTLVQGVWFGYDMPQQIAVNASGGRLAAPAWAEIYQAGWREPRGGDFAVPAGMISKVVDPTTGQLATRVVPDSHDAVVQARRRAGRDVHRAYGPASGPDRDRREREHHQCTRTESARAGGAEHRQSVEANHPLVVFARLASRRASCGVVAWYWPVSRYDWDYYFADGAESRGKSKSKATTKLLLTTKSVFGEIGSFREIVAVCDSWQAIGDEGHGAGVPDCDSIPECKHTFARPDLSWRCASRRVARRARPTRLPETIRAISHRRVVESRSAGAGRFRMTIRGTRLSRARRWHRTRRR